MSILGKLAWLGLGVGSVVEAGQNQKIKNECLESAARRGKEWYTDVRTGKMYIVETGQEIYFTNNNLGERELRYKTGGLYKNLTIEESKQYAIDHGWGYYRQKVAQFKNRRFYKFELSTGKRYEVTENWKRYKKATPPFYDYVIYFTIHYYKPHQEWELDCLSNPPARQITGEEFISLSSKVFKLDQVQGWKEYAERVGYDRANIGFDDHEGEERILSITEQLQKGRKNINE